MKVVAFNGSPRNGGNTEYLLKTLLDTISQEGIETELVQIGGKLIRGCTACGKCIEKQNKKCAINNDIVNECIEKMIEADGIIFGSPSYFADMSSETKALIDRAGFVAFANGRLFARKIGAAVVAQRKGGAINVFDSINHMFLMSRMIVPGSTYWNFGCGMDKGDIANDTEAIENMKDLGQTIAWLIKKTVD
ncbi:MAG TPA: flavodoxin family protein [Sedimentisphaerales bacterium]|nr:flavodoxin family protein [Sedimentisphaerales bacterium]